MMQGAWDSGMTFHTRSQPMDTLESARSEEQAIITANLGNPHLMNISTGVNGGDNLTRNPNRQEIIDRMSLSLRKTISEMSPQERKDLHSQPGEKNGMFGRTHTPEARAKISEANRQREPRRGFNLTEEAKEKLRAKAALRTGEKNGFFGKTHTQESIDRAVAARRRHYESTGNVYAQAKTVMVDGVTYPSAREAAAQLDIGYTLLIHRLKSPLPKYSDYQYLDKSPTTIESTDDQSVSE
jgi:hypothetical protein